MRWSLALQCHRHKPRSSSGMDAKNSSRVRRMSATGSRGASAGGGAAVAAGCASGSGTASPPPSPSSASRLSAESSSSADAALPGAASSERSSSSARAGPSWSSWQGAIIGRSLRQEADAAHMKRCCTPQLALSACADAGRCPNAPAPPAVHPLICPAANPDPPPTPPHPPVSLRSVHPGQDGRRQGSTAR